jgi:HK97 family phage prohead protease
MKNVEYKSFEIKAVDFNEEKKEMRISGYAATFGNTDAMQITWQPEIKDYVYASDTIEKGAFNKTITERKERIKFCKNHNIDNPVGKIVELKEDENGLFIDVRISDAEPELKTKIQEGIYDEMSIGFQTIKSLWEKKADSTWLRKLTEVKLYEVSVVTIARDENAKITDIKSAAEAISIVNSLIDKEKNEEKKYQLLQLKSLMTDEPVTPLVPETEPITPKVDVDEFKNTILQILKN